MPPEIRFAKAGYYNPNTGSDKFSGAGGVDFHLTAATDDNSAGKLPLP
ncbi:MAG: hypothetical protein PHY82_09935 [Lentisphaeria bacterium]|nr:hypothetical protein [Lentisphaeria bacterium]